MQLPALQLFVFAYEDAAGEIKKKPIYAVAYKLAEDEAVDWLIAHSEYLWVSLDYSREDVIIDGVLYPATKEREASA